MASSPPPLISTNPKPRERPVSRSITTWALVTVPYSAKRFARSSDVVPKARFPTYNFFIRLTLLRPLSGRYGTEPSVGNLPTDADVRTQRGAYNPGTGGNTGRSIWVCGLERKAQSYATRKSQKGSCEQVRRLGFAT